MEQGPNVYRLATSPTYALDLGRLSVEELLLHRQQIEGAAERIAALHAQDLARFDEAINAATHESLL